MKKMKINAIILTAVLAIGVIAYSNLFRGVTPNESKEISVTEGISLFSDYPEYDENF